MSLIALAQQMHTYSLVLNDISHQSVLIWLITGVLAGFIASLIVRLIFNNHSLGVERDILWGIVGAVIGSGLFNYFGRGKVLVLNLMSLFIGVIGGLVTLLVYYKLFSRSEK